MIGTLLYVVRQCERHSELTEEMSIPLRPIPKEDGVDVSENKLGNKQKLADYKVLDKWKVTLLNLLHYKLSAAERTVTGRAICLIISC